ncbi:hypothetical protein CYMTET_48641 [Cymbomonas tetramitiformis]|uniref:Fucosyltransferase n=1 Tax=Cymbomonas tetramitiformis TaxID=36881 RepID=A0AAE0BTG4_9CHLO|nr:hypothetical protein CYMTET_48641 [Cymbomonas tetramitiformis]
MRSRAKKPAKVESLVRQDLSTQQPWEKHESIRMAGTSGRGKITIGLVGHTWYGEYLLKQNEKMQRECSVPCEFVQYRTRNTRDADPHPPSALFFGHSEQRVHKLEVQRIHAHVPQSSPWIIWCSEPRGQWPCFHYPKEGGRMEDTDWLPDNRQYLTANFDLHSDIPITFGDFPLLHAKMTKFKGWKHPDTAKDASSWVQEWVGHVKRAASSRDIFASVFMRECTPRRTPYLQELMNVLQVNYGYKVASFGNCLHNSGRSMPDLDGRILLQAQSTFCLVFDKADIEGYLSEQLSMAWVAGCIPVYWGRGQVEEMAPHPRSFVNANAFQSAALLAERLHAINTGDKLYLEHTEWRSRGLSPNYIQYLSEGWRTGGCRMCQAVADYQEQRRPGRVKPAPAS